jgi:DNA-binding response OmpR family regulator/anti-sigma regulatory factor (Ser/Thr protein kinase)
VNEQILIVEDSETQALKLRFLLEHEGWRVSCAATGEAALEDLNRSLPALIIADYHLPGLRGDELCRRVRMNVRTRGIPILMLTMEQGFGTEPAGLDSGADDYLSKSVAPDILILRVRTLLRNAQGRLSLPGSPDPLFRRARLLAIDDSPTYLAHLTEVLAGEGYDVTPACNGDEALGYLARGAFDCVVVDLIMPKMDGIEVCRRVAELTRKGKAGPPPAIVMLTSSETQDDMTRGLEAGADDFVGKSSDMTVLKARIRALLRRKFFQEENSRIVEELKNKELETAHARAQREAELNRELKQAYEDLRQTQESVIQQERLRVLGQMASGIAHDINNAISPVTLYTYTLLEREPNLTPRTREVLEIIQRSIEDVAHTVSRMREFYRPREPELELAPVPVNELVQQVVDLTRARWCDIPQQRGVVIDVRLELAGDLPPVAGVESEIREALTNLVFNAVDAMPDGGTLTLRTTPAAATGGRSVNLEIIDAGTGMDPETKRRCLEPFFTSKGERGTGLGLAMVYGVVRRHSAGLEIESEPGSGTTIRLTFPVAAPIEVTADDAASGGSSGLCILLVDDEPILLSSLQEILEADGHCVTTARGGQEAVDAIGDPRRRGSFDVVITDLGMPYVDGGRVAAAAKHAAPHKPVILLTGWGDKLKAEGTIPPGVDCVLSKPPKLRDLRSALAQCADGTLVRVPA